MVHLHTKQAGQQIKSKVLKRANNCEALALEGGVIFLREGKFLSKEGNRALDSGRVALQYHCADSEFRGVCGQRERRLVIQICEPRRDTQAALELVESLNVFGGEVHWLSILVRGGEVVKRGGKRGLLVNEVRVEVHKA